jgi:hypothetical protein
MEAHQETERRLSQLLRMPLPNDAKQQVRDIAADVVVPVLRRDGDAAKSAASTTSSASALKWHCTFRPASPARRSASIRRQ